jgi:hypothetical protein
MTNTDLLCEFITNPFGHEKDACDLLSKVDDRPPSDDELERGRFCFQIALYFLACLSITARIEESFARRRAIDRLNDRVRTFHALNESQLTLAAFVVAPAEKDRFTAALRLQSDEADAARGDTAAPSTTMLALFDFVVAQRLCDYVDAIGQSHDPGSLYPVAERLLFHYGAREYRRGAVAAIADLLAAKYNAASVIVASGLQDVVDSPRIGEDGTLLPMPLTPRMPDVTGRRPSRTYLVGGHMLRLVEDVGAVGGGIIKYRYVLGLCDQQLGLPICLVTLEDSSSISNVLGVFEQNGSHSNYGALRTRNPEEFIGEGMRLIKDRFDLGEFKEVHGSPQSRWKFWQTSEAVVQTAA